MKRLIKMKSEDEKRGAVRHLGHVGHVSGLVPRRGGGGGKTGSIVCSVTDSKRSTAARSSYTSWTWRRSGRGRAFGVCAIPGATHGTTG